MVEDFWSMCAAVYFAMTLNFSEIEVPCYKQRADKLLHRQLYSQGGSRTQWQGEWRGSAQWAWLRTGNPSHLLAPLCLPLLSQCRLQQVETSRILQKTSKPRTRNSYAHWFFHPHIADSLWAQQWWFKNDKHLILFPDVIQRRKK